MHLTESYYPADTRSPVLELTLGDLLGAAAGDSGDHTALIALTPGAQARTWTYAELLADAERGASWLLERFDAGSHIAVWAANDPEWLILQCATALAGMTLVTANPALRGRELAHVLAASHADAVAFSDEVRGTLMAPILYEALDIVRLRSRREPLRVPSLIPFAGWLDTIRETPVAEEFPVVRPHDAIQLQFTSGTTGLPKPAQLSHSAMITNAALVNERSGLTSAGVGVSPLPLFHTAGSGLAGFGSFLTRSALVLPRTFDPDLILDGIETYGATDVRMVPAMFRAVLDRLTTRRANLETVRIVSSGGDALPRALSSEIERAFGAPLTTVYGQTELSPILAQTSPSSSEAERWDTAGAPLPQVEVKICDPETGSLLPIGERGEICARGYQVVDGYYGMPEASAELIDTDGWLHTGDIGFMSETGALTITGRVKDLIIRGGENIYPREVEEAIQQHPDVSLAAVVGIPDERWGETVAATIQFTPDSAPASAHALKEFLRPRLSPQKIPSSWFEADSLPMNAMGKLQKHLLRDGLMARAYKKLLD
ncbi:fatty-acyl-CoA synthase/long-chain acyl-CoA synthetase [Leucobacter komagatae]|uniref:Fatty-acyl-CoA synthase/long-chain acyl-CoA synthetase n=1 Tax=Leucobacter komagatae TaxID=55969 RepID=A0A542Y267_9MICO|nr:AMP-binding protein [Leucobacter komagatae]TQL42171.1 fatty-acyl-CoA synthase/long-chain acyl-CoA synthetase [Leucobacter komagatae]